MVKVGSRLFTAEGPAVVRQLARIGFGIFLDLKFHDIPSTVSGAVAAAVKLPGVRLVTLHTLGGAEVLDAAVKAARGAKHPPELLGVTVLTSHDATSLRRVGIAGTPSAAALKLARIAKDSGCDGVVCSAYEVRAIRRALGPKFLIVVPGIRPAIRDERSVACPRLPKPFARARAISSSGVLSPLPRIRAKPPRTSCRKYLSSCPSADASCGNRLAPR